MLIIFDCDGVLRSVSSEAIYYAYIAIAEYLGKDPQDFWKSIDDFKQWHNSDWQLNLEQMGVARGSDYAPINKLFHEVHDPHIQTFPWVMETMKELASRHTLAVLSAALATSVRESLNGSSEFFSLVIGCEHVKNVKPDPEGIHLIMSETGARARETLIIGDTYADIAAGKNAGVRTAGVTWGLTKTLREMEDLKPDHIFMNPEMLNLL